MTSLVSQTELTGINLVKRGKVRDIYDMGDCLLMVATDRLSAFDVVLPDPIPEKGRVLTRISRFWFDYFKSIVANHMITDVVADYPPACQPHARVLEGRSMLVKKARPLAIECVVRGYLSGSGWKDYQRSGAVCGIALPPGLKESEKLPQPLFTPSTKEEVGIHDQNIDFAQACERIGSELAARARDLSLALYLKGAELADQKGIIIADTKFEFGLVGDELILIDEALTPDSSRFWPKDTYRPGGPQQSFDKQFVRDYLLAIKWNQKPPAPALPADVIAGTSAKYLEALKRLTT